MQLRGRVGRDIDVGAARSRQPPNEMIDHAAIDAQSGRRGLVDHPQQRKFRKTAFGFRIAAADVAMHAGNQTWRIS